MWLLGVWPILVLVLATGLVAFGAAVSWVAFRTKHAFTVATALSAGTMVIAAFAFWRGSATGHPHAAVPFQIAAVVTIGAGLVIVLGEMARSRRGPGDDGDDRDDG